MKAKRKPLWGIWKVAQRRWMGGSRPSMFHDKNTAERIRYSDEIVRRIGWYDPEPLKEKK